MLKPGGRAAIVLPQGKFNNSSLAFIREWILKKARLLAVVGLHPNTFKPHTGTKTSVLFFQKYTAEALAQIEQVKQEVAKACPDYEQQIKDLIAEAPVPRRCAGGENSRRDSRPHGRVICEPEPESAETETGYSEDDYEIEEPELRMAAEGNPTHEELISEAEEKRDTLKAELIRVKQKLTDLDSDVEALQQQQQMEIDAITQQWEGDKAGTAGPSETDQGGPQSGPQAAQGQAENQAADVQGRNQAPGKGDPRGGNRRQAAQQQGQTGTDPGRPRPDRHAERALDRRRGGQATRLSDLHGRERARRQEQLRRLRISWWTKTAAWWSFPTAIPRKASLWWTRTWSTTT